MGTGRQVLFLDGNADRVERPQRADGIEMVYCTGCPQEGGEMNEAERANVKHIAKWDTTSWDNFYNWDGDITIKGDFEWRAYEWAASYGSSEEE